ncbi:MAG TPA: hypothetical protein VII06_42010 [Chloroflexota bacterium]|jgi:hypothetical protein
MTACNSHAVNRSAKTTAVRLDCNDPIVVDQHAAIPVPAWESTRPRASNRLTEFRCGAIPQADSEHLLDQEIDLLRHGMLASDW